MPPSVSAIELTATALFALAIVHTFSTRLFERLAHRRPQHAGLWHLLGEVEVVFGLWAMVLILVMVALEGTERTTTYLDTRNFTEPMFVFAIMVAAGTRPILQLASDCVRFITRYVPFGVAGSFYFSTLAVVPLMGSFITEPAAMTLAALILRDRFYVQGISRAVKYGTLGVLFVNVSIGGMLTPYAAPPVLMVADTWGWDLGFMMANLGWKAAVAVGVNSLVATVVFARQIQHAGSASESPGTRVPASIVVFHLLFLAGIVVFAHHPPVFIGVLLFFLGFADAYERYQDRLILREGLLVGFFLAGLVVLGGLQRWWLRPLLLGMDSTSVYFGAAALTAITDNAALTYLGSLVEGLTPEFKYALVAGAVTGGGLTVIANAPNPAGFSILRDYFDDGAINPIGLFVAALPPTICAMIAFWFL